jgi:predicted secreted protein
MSSEYGKDWRIEIGDGAGTEVFTAIGGETGFDWSRSSQEIDISDKDSGVYGSRSYGQQTISIRVQGNVKLPDVALERASDQAKASPPELNVRIRKGVTTKFAGKVAIGNFSTSHPKDGPVTYSFDLSNVGAPTTDDLGA